MGCAVCLKCGVRTGMSGYHAVCRRHAQSDPLGPLRQLAEEGTGSELELELGLELEGAPASRGGVADESLPGEVAGPLQVIGGGLDDAEGDPFEVLGE